MTRKILIASSLALAVALAGGATAWSQTPMPDPLDDRSVKRLEKMEKVVRELRAIVFQGRDTGKPVVVQDAETGVLIAALTGNEELGMDLDRTKQALAASEAANRQLSERLAGLETRLAALEAAAVAAPTEEQAAAAATPVDPDELFALGRRQMADGDYSAAEVSFDRYVETFGDTPRAPEARYWLGKTLSARGDNAKAAGAYLGAVRGWPRTSWAPDAVVELARSLVAQKLPADACQALSELPRRYPNAAAGVTTRAQAVRTQAKCAG
jgi:tol-pal system protein YbgF